MTTASIEKIQAPETEKLAPFYRWVAILLALCVVNNVFRFTPSFPQTIFYAVVIALNLLLLLGGGGSTRQSSVCVSMWLFWAVMWGSIGWNYAEISPDFQASYRTLAFFLVLLLFAPWITTPGIDQERMVIFKTLNGAMLFMAVLSFFGRVFHFLPTDEQGFYLGCTHHSMNLAAVAGIACLYALYKRSAAQTASRQLRYGIYFLCAFLVILFAASRTVLFACVMAVLGYFSASGSTKVSNIVKAMMLLGCMLFVIHLAMPEAFSGLLKKSASAGNQLNIETLTLSRQSVWQNRIDEIKDFPIFGTGAHSIRYGTYGVRGQIEPGNAWLYVFSSMGIFAFLFFCFLFFTGLRRAAFFSQSSNEAKLVLGLLIFFGMYMNGEAHITAVGEFTCSYFWLLVAIAMTHPFTPDVPKGTEPGGAQ